MSTAQPVLRGQAARLYQQVGPVEAKDAEAGWAAANLCAVLTAPVEDVTEWASDVGTVPGWSNIVDVDRAPLVALTWLGQFNGTQLDTAQSEDDQRRQIREARGRHRGRRSAIISDVQATLTGTRYVDLQERVTHPFRATVVTLRKETPNPDATLAALNNRVTKPLGVVYTLAYPPSPIIDEFVRNVADITGIIDVLTRDDVL